MKFNYANLLPKTNTLYGYVSELERQMDKLATLRNENDSVTIEVRLRGQYEGKYAAVTVTRSVFRQLNMGTKDERYIRHQWHITINDERILPGDLSEEYWGNIIK